MESQTKRARVISPVEEQEMEEAKEEAREFDGTCGRCGHDIEPPYTEFCQSCLDDQEQEEEDCKEEIEQQKLAKEAEDTGKIVCDECGELTDDDEDDKHLCGQ